MVHYLDNAATTPVRPSAVAAMLPLLTEIYGNPSGAHRMARDANRVLDDARATMAEALGAQPGQIVFTGGGTEADALALRGTVAARGGIPVCSAIEHHAVLDPVHHLGGRVVAVDADGRLDLAALEEALDPSVSLVSVMLANNETGIIQPIAEAVEIVRRKAPGALFHTDAVQALCWVDVAEAAAAADLVSVSAHKFGGPKGVGVLVVRDGADPEPLLLGGGQERARRGGTQNVAGIAAMAVAAAETVAERPAALPRVAALRDRLANGIRAALPGVVETGVPGADRRHKTANICHLCFVGIESEALLFLLEKQDIMASAASSCASGAIDPSHVLLAMGFDRDLAFGSLRLSLGYGTTEADVDAALAVVPAAVTRLRERGS
ncbi:MAG: cysteine desulfurase [Acidimicrobiia bacterium]|nr:cysteine desulfurase [Acidimicrobiia bacterium]MDH5291582.1 cysteine desulfurase [Acidimicrobiia bacterium]